MNALLVFFRLTEDNWGEGYRCRGVSLISGATPFIEHAGIGMEINWISIFFGGETTHQKKRDNARFGMAYDFTSNKG
jgi:hypothetical protein